MTSTTPASREQEVHREPNEQDSKLERLVKKVEPPGREVTDEDIKDPGNMTPGAPPTDNRS